jgi:DNA polymerase III epsilon subunit-like protein
MDGFLWLLALLAVAVAGYWLFGRKRPTVSASPAPAIRPSQQSSARSSTSQRVYVSEGGGLTITATFSGPFGHEPPEPTQAEVDELLLEYAFLADMKPKAVKKADLWWVSTTHERRVKDGAATVSKWLAPFVSEAILSLPELKPAIEAGAGYGGPYEAQKALRAAIRAKRKAKAAYDEELRALYGVGIAGEVARNLFNRIESSIAGWPAELLAQSDVEALHLDYTAIGYQQVSSFGKTDVKWFVQAWGEPSQHQAVGSFASALKKAAMARGAWAKFSDTKKYRESLTFEEWLAEAARHALKWSKPAEPTKLSEEELAELRELEEREEASRQQAWTALEGDHVIVDLETTGLDPTDDEIIEIGAIRLRGTAIEEFSVLVKPRGGVSPFITRLTGITPELLSREGSGLEEAMRRFERFADGLPLFAHNAAFDQSFLTAAARATGVPIRGPFHDTLSLCQEAWPNLRNHKLSSVAKHVGAPTPDHRALGDARATLAVTKALRQQRKPSGPLAHREMS